MSTTTLRSGTVSQVQSPPLAIALIGLTVALVLIGLVFVYSSSGAYALHVFGNSHHFVVRQALWATIGLASLVVASSLPAELLRKLAPFAVFGSIVLAAVVLIPSIGHRVGGARRWLTLGVVGFQPSELVKLAVVLGGAAILSKSSANPDQRIGSFLGLVQIPVALILAEPDLGTALVVEAIALTMALVAGISLRIVGLITLAALPVLYHFVVGTKFRLMRLLSFLDPWAYREGAGYQLTEALIAIGSGGAAGVGLGESRHKLFFLPEAHTDFIFAILAEELGFIGVGLVLVLFAAWMSVAIEIANRSNDRFDGLLAVGVFAMVAVPAVLNLLVVVGMVPTKGLPLPFLSSGGSNLWVNLVAVGLLARVSAPTGGSR